MKIKRSRSLAQQVAIVVFVLAFASAASAEWKEKVLYSFQGGTDGAMPAGGVVFGKDGSLYGATRDGGAANCASIYQCGTVYQLSLKNGVWTETVLYVFKGGKYGDGASPGGGLIADATGNLYGVTEYGGTGDCVLLGDKVGCGAVYEMTPPKTKGGAWTEKVIYSFPTSKQGYVPWGDLAFDGAGNLYGVTEYGGGRGTTCNPFYQYCGGVYELSPPKTEGGKWTEKTLYGFRGLSAGALFGDGANPRAGLVLDGKGNIFGTTYIGGYNCPHNSEQGCGTAFELERPTKSGGRWTETILRRFQLGEAHPAAAMTFHGANQLYGTNGGAIFRLTHLRTKSGRWKESILHTFDQQAYDAQDRLTFDQGGNLYGTTYSGSGNTVYGVVFRLRSPIRKGGSLGFSVLHGFAGSPDGAQPAASLSLDKDGNLYSTTTSGGTGTTCSFGCGTVFKVWP